MRTTVRLDDALLQKAWQEAERRGVTLASLIEQGLQLVLRLPAKSTAKRVGDGSTCLEGEVLRPGVKIKSHSGIFDRIYRRD